jgi:hypothetical protein
VDERDHGATPPGVYQLTLRESLFHGVQALRLTPVGGGFTFNRVGLLAHPYMLGPNGDSNGCVSFKNYDVFLRALSSASRSSHNGLDVLASLGLSQASARRPISDVFGGWPVSCVELAQGRANVARDASLGRLLRWWQRKTSHQCRVAAIL